MTSTRATSVQGCEMCEVVGGTLIVRAARWRVVRVANDDYPAFYRVIWNEHKAEFTDLSVDERVECMNVLAAIETCLIEQLAPTKINLATFGNMVPHLHWHVFARYEWDRHFPQTIWAAPIRDVDPPAEGRLAVGLDQLDAAMAQKLDALTLLASV